MNPVFLVPKDSILRDGEVTLPQIPALFTLGYSTPILWFKETLTN
jgi:hypothetical protein